VRAREIDHRRLLDLPGIEGPRQVGMVEHGFDVPAIDDGIEGLHHPRLILTQFDVLFAAWQIAVLLPELARCPGVDWRTEETTDEQQDKVIMVEPKGRPTVTIDRLAGNEKKPVIFKIRLNGISGTECTLRYSSTRGGVVEKKV
jgi:hypothetical protein